MTQWNQQKQFFFQCKKFIMEYSFILAMLCIDSFLSFILLHYDKCFTGSLIGLYASSEQNVCTSSKWNSILRVLPQTRSSNQLRTQLVINETYSVHVHRKNVVNSVMPNIKRMRNVETFQLCSHNNHLKIYSGHCAFLSL